MTTPYSSFAATTGQQGTYSTNSTQGTPGVPTATPTTFVPILPAPNSDQSQSQPSTPTPAGRGNSKASTTGTKRGRKPRGTMVPGASSPRPFITKSLAPAPGGAPGTSSSIPSLSSQAANAQYSRVHWAAQAGTGTESGTSSIPAARSTVEGNGPSNAPRGDSVVSASAPAAPVIDPALVGVAVTSSIPGTPRVDVGFNVPARSLPQPQPPGVARSGPGAVEEDVEGDDEMLPAMADDDYSAQLSWQSQSKDNLKVLMDNFNPAQYDRFEAYRRHALPKQAVRKVIQQTLGHQVSQPVAQIIAGFSKVFVGEIIEKARAVQTRRGDHGPLSPDHLREAYRAYQAETGRVGAARPLRSKKLFVR